MLCKAITGLQARCLDVTAASSQQLLASVKSGGLPLVLMGASTGPDEVMKGIELGAVDYLAMPISPLKLRNIWQHVVRKVILACIRTCAQYVR